jgi:hypothetical protein
MKPNFLNLFMKKFTRERVVPIISANVSCEQSAHWASTPPYKHSQRARYKVEAQFAELKQ